MTVIDRSRLYSAVSEVARDASRQLFKAKNVFFIRLLRYFRSLLLPWSSLSPSRSLGTTEL